MVLFLRITLLFISLIFLTSSFISMLQYLPKFVLLKRAGITRLIDVLNQNKAYLNELKINTSDNSSYLEIKNIDSAIDMGYIRIFYNNNSGFIRHKNFISENKDKIKWFYIQDKGKTKFVWVFLEEISFKNKAKVKKISREFSLLKKNSYKYNYFLLNFYYKNEIKRLSKACSPINILNILPLYISIPLIWTYILGLSITPDGSDLLLIILISILWTLIYITIFFYVLKGRRIVS